MMELFRCTILEPTNQRRPFKTALVKCFLNFQIWQRSRVVLT